jgi:hypothetical protein
MRKILNKLSFYFFLNLNLKIKIEYIIISVNNGISAIPILLKSIFETNLIVVSDKIIIKSPVKKVKILNLE